MKFTPLLIYYAISVVIAVFGNPYVGVLLMMYGIGMYLGEEIRGLKDKP